MKRLADMTEPEITHWLNLLAAATESIMPAADNPRGRALFAVVVFDDPGIARMVTNGRRDDVFKAIREAFSEGGVI